MPDEEMTLPIRVVDVVDDVQVACGRTVFCPIRNVTTSVTECRRCVDFADVGPDDTMVCRRNPPVALVDAARLVERRCICTGAENLFARTALGSLGRRHVLCASRNARVDVIRERLAHSDAHGVVVVDPERRPVGFVSRRRFWSAVPPAADLVLAESPDEPYLALADWTPLARALDRMIRTHQRVVVTVDADYRATAVVLDLDILKWFGDAARGQ